MVRMGEQLPDQARSFISTAVEASEEVADQLASAFRVDVDSADVSEVAAMLAKEMRREAFLKANGAKFERELVEKYGVLKDVILHPTVQWLLGLCAQLWRSFHLFGKPPLGTTAGVVVALMIYRRKVGFVYMSLAVAVLSGLNPLVVVAVALASKMWASVKFLPRGFKLIDRENATAGDVGPDKLSDDFEPEKVSTAAGEEYDHVVVGSDLGGLFCAALLSRCGRRVLVLEQGPLIGGGAVVKAPEGAGGWEFETGVQCLGGGDKLERFAKRLQLACLPKESTMSWEKVGQLESDLCVHDMVSVADGQQTVLFPAEQEKLLESLMAQFPERRAFFRAFFGQAEKEMKGGSMAYYLLKLFASRPVRWLDRIVVALFAAAPAMAHVEIAKRSVSEMMGAMMKVQPDGNDDLEAAQAALCAMFRSENLTPSRVSCAALMGHTSSAWGGLYHPRGGFRALAENLVDAVRASGGRALTRARTGSVIVRDGRAVGVRVSREGGGGAATNASSSSSSSGAGTGAGAAAEVLVSADGLGSVISSIGVIDSFRGLVPPLPKDAGVAAAAADGAHGGGGTRAGAAASAAAGAVAGGGETVKELGEKDGEGLDPAGFRILRAARPRVHLCVGLQGNWLEDLDGTSAYVHHVRNSMVEGGGGGGGSDRHNDFGKQDWCRISFGESKDSTGWKKGTTTVVVTAEMADDMAKMTIDGVGTTNEPIGPLRYTVLTGRSTRDRMRERMLRRLHREFPQTEGRDEFVMLTEQPRAGLSAGPERYLAKGVRAPTKLPGFFLAGEDLTISGMEGGVMGGWIAAHAALGYTATDMFLRGRSLASDIPNLDKLYGKGVV